jgi:hypothetical protein
MRKDPAKEAVQKTQNGNQRAKAMKTRTCGLNESHPAFVTKLPIMAVASVAAALVFLPNSAQAQTNVKPELSINASGTNDVVNVTVMNGDSQLAYFILFSSNSPDVNAFVNPPTTLGSIGQTNFYLPLGAFTRGFYRATSTNDWDNDGVVNWEDAQPYTNSVGRLTVTIELPANGSTINN